MVLTMTLCSLCSYSYRRSCCYLLAVRLSAPTYAYLLHLIILILMTCGTSRSLHPLLSGMSYNAFQQGCDRPILQFMDVLFLVIFYSMPLSSPVFLAQFDSPLYSLSNHYLYISRRLFEVGFLVYALSLIAEFHLFPLWCFQIGENYVGYSLSFTFQLNDVSPT